MIVKGEGRVREGRGSDSRSNSRPWEMPRRVSHLSVRDSVIYLLESMKSESEKKTIRMGRVIFVAIPQSSLLIALSECANFNKTTLSVAAK